jgi:dTDP-4-dehydrorhamnose reductase
LRPGDALAPGAAPGFAAAPAPALEMWGGLECSHVRIQGEDRDQCAESGHWDRPEDLDLIAGLGLAKLRYPLLWARIAQPDGSFDFAPDAARFERLRALGQVPIAGFLHHGWGPGGLHPLDPEFVPAFAAFAGAAAERLDWIEDFTPINEPVTTARFSYLYGHWHPHLCDEAAFLRAVATMAVATSAAMAAIRKRIPQARLIQTEDVGRTFASPGLAHQAEYENLRRFLGFDLATGRVDRAHPFWPRLIAAGRLDRRA